MKFNLRYLANLFVAALLFCATGCKDDDTSGPEMPAVKIAPGATTASSISFTATPSMPTRPHTSAWKRAC